MSLESKVSRIIGFTCSALLFICIASCVMYYTGSGVAIVHAVVSTLRLGPLVVSSIYLK